MNQTTPKILIVDDNPEIHADFHKVLVGETPTTGLDDLESSLFGDQPETTAGYTLDDAHQGIEAVKMVQDAIAAGNPYGLVFVDVRMPPGMDGVQTIEALHKVDPALNCVICTAYSDYTPEAAKQKIGISDGLLFISKPFDPAIIRQLAKAMVDRLATAA